MSERRWAHGLGTIHDAQCTADDQLSHNPAHLHFADTANPANTPPFSVDFFCGLVQPRPCRSSVQLLSNSTFIRHMAPAIWCQ